MKVVAIIPARYNSTRLPGKPLKDICGKTMLQRVYDRVAGISEIDEIYVATDDVRIMKYCEEAKLKCLMTSSTHQTAANRLQEASEQIEADYYL